MSVTADLAVNTQRLDYNPTPSRDLQHGAADARELRQFASSWGLARKSVNEKHSECLQSHVRRDKAALFQRVQTPPGDRSSRKQPEQAWR